MLPGGPYDLWRADEPSRRVKDLLGAFAQNPKLPKMLRQKEILDTIEQGVRDGIFIATLTRPDKSVRTFWRTDIDESSRKEPALEVFLPEKGGLSELRCEVLVPNVLPGLWKGEVTTVADAIFTSRAVGRRWSTKRGTMNGSPSRPAQQRPLSLRSPWQ